MNADGSITDRKNFSDAQKQTVAKAEAAYTKTVNNLMNHPDRPATIKGPDGKKTTEVAGKVGTQLIHEDFTAHPEMKGLDMDTALGQTRVGVQGLSAPPGLYGLSGLPRDLLYQIEFVHEGFHAVNASADNMWAGRSDFDSDHQKPYNRAAYELLK